MDDDIHIGGALSFDDDAGVLWIDADHWAAGAAEAAAGGDFDLEFRIHNSAVPADFTFTAGFDINAAHGDHGESKGHVPNRPNKGVDSGSKRGRQVIPQHLIRLQHGFPIGKIGVVLVIKGERSAWVQVHHCCSIWCSFWTQAQQLFS